MPSVFIRANQVLMDPSEHLESLDCQVRLVNPAPLENLVKLDLLVFLESLDFQVKQAKKDRKALLDLKANKDPSVHPDCQDSPASEVLLDYL